MDAGDAVDAGEDAHRPQVADGVELVGRDAERSQLVDAWARAADARPSLLIVEGEAGVGKSALARDLMLLAERDGVVLGASGEEAERRLDFGVVEQLFDEAVALGLAADLPFGRGELRPDPLEVGGALVDLLVRTSASSTTLLVVDDAQWSDVASIQALTFALRRLRRHRVLAVVLHRPTAPFLEPLHRLCADGRGRRLSLGGLDARQLRELVGRRCGVVLTPAAAQRLHAHTQGSPLEALMLAEELGAETLNRRFDALPAPRSYATLVLNRLAGCAAETERLVAAVAVLGHPAPIGSLPRLLDVDDIGAPLDEAVEHGLLVVDRRAGTPVVDVVHPLLRAAVIYDLAPGRRAELHRLAARVTTDAPRATLHRLGAVIGTDEQLGLDAIELARQQAEDGWLLTAVDLLAAAAQVLADGPTRTDALLLAADLLLRMTDVSSARELLDLVPTGSGGAYEPLLRGQLAFLEGNTERALEALRAAWQDAPDDDLAPRVAMLLATLAANRANGERARTWARRALAKATTSRDETGTRLRVDTEADRDHALVMLASAWALDGDLAAGRAEVDEWLERTADAGRSDASVASGLLLLWDGDLAEAIAVLGQALAAGQADGDEAAGRTSLLSAAACYSLADAHYRAGNWDAALELAERLAVELDDADRLMTAPMAHGVAAFVLAARGEPARAADHLERGWRAMEAIDNPSAALWMVVAAARAAEAQGDDAGVVAQLGPLSDLTADLRLPEGVQPWRADLVAALTRLDRLDEAEAALAALEARLGGGGAHARAGAARARGVLAAARGDDDRAAAAFAAGLDDDPEEAGAFARARLEVAAGSFERRKGRRRAAFDLLTTARARFDRLDAAPYVDRVDRELAVCGLTPRGRDESGPPELTPSEEVVASLVAEGLTNREVASTLSVSVKTVESHLSRVFNKLGVRSRTELAARWPAADARRPPP